MEWTARVRLSALGVVAKSPGSHVFMYWLWRVMHIGRKGRGRLLRTVLLLRVTLGLLTL